MKLIIKKSIFLAWLGILLLFSAPCNATNNPMEQQETSGTEAKQTNNIVNRWDLSDQDLLSITLVSSTLAIVLALILMILMVKKPSRTNKANIRSQELKNYNKSIKISDSNNNLPQNGLNPNPLSKQDIELLIQELIDKNIENIAIKIIEHGYIDKEKTLQVSEDQSHENAKVSYLYASSADKNNNTFFKVTQQPDEDTIYKFTIMRNITEFKVYEAAFKRVLMAPGCLECACEVSTSGSQSVVTKKQGTAERQSDGIWRIISKAEIKFE